MVKTNDKKTVCARYTCYYTIKGNQPIAPAKIERFKRSLCRSEVTLNSKPSSTMSVTRMAGPAIVVFLFQEESIQWVVPNCKHNEKISGVYYDSNWIKTFVFCLHGPCMARTWLGHGSSMARNGPHGSAKHGCMAKYHSRKLWLCVFEFSEITLYLLMSCFKRGSQHLILISRLI